MPILIKGGDIRKSFLNFKDPEQSAIVHEIKRMGLFIDRYVDLQMRVGDTLVFYLSRTCA